MVEETTSNNIDAEKVEESEKKDLTETDIRKNPYSENFVNNSNKAKSQTQMAVYII